MPVDLLQLKGRQPIDLLQSKGKQPIDLFEAKRKSVNGLYNIPPEPQPLPPPTQQEQLAKESTDYGFNVLTGTANEAGKDLLNLGRKTFEPIVAPPYQMSRMVTDPIGEAIRQRTWEATKQIPGKIENNLVDMGLGMGESMGRPLGFSGYDAFRESWATDPYSSALGIAPIVAPIIARGVGEVSARLPKKEPVISPEARQAYTSGIQEIGQTLKNIPDEVRPKQARTVAGLREQMRSALFKNDIATINSIVADFREGQVIPTTQQPKPILNIPSQILQQQQQEVDLPKGETPLIPQQEVAVPPPQTRRMSGGIRKPVDLLAPQGEPVIEQQAPEIVLHTQTKDLRTSDDLQKSINDIEANLTFEESQANPTLEKLYNEREKAYDREKIEFVDKVISDAGIDQNEGEKALKNVYLGKDSVVSSFHDTIKNWNKAENFEDRNIVGLYNSLVDQKHYELLPSLRWGGTPGKPEIMAPGRFVFDPIAIRKTERLYNAVSRNTGQAEINLSSFLQKMPVEQPTIKQSLTVETPKEPWQMTKDEYNENVYQNSAIQRQLIIEHEKIRKNKGFDLYKWWDEVAPHKKIIRQALSEGKPVPPEVLKDYPDIVPREKPNVPSVQTDKIPVPDEGSLKKGKPKFVQPKMFEGKKVDIKPTLDTEVAGQGKLFGTPSGEAEAGGYAQTEKLDKLKQSLVNNQYDPSIPLSHYQQLGKPQYVAVAPGTPTQDAFRKLRTLLIDNRKGMDELGGHPIKSDADYLNRNLSHKGTGNVKAGQLTPEQIGKMTSDVNIGREGKPSIKSDAELRYAPGTGINLETLDLPPDIKHTIYKLTQQYQPAFEEQRNKKTWEEINKEAESSGFNAEQLLERQKGEAYNAAKLKAVKDIQNNTTFEAKRIVDYSVKLLNNPLLTDEQQAEILATANLKMKKAAAILAQAGGAYSEAGRALNILRQVTGARKAEKNWKAILDSLGGKEMTLDIFRKISKVDISSVPETAKFIREVQKARTADMVLEAWRNAILSGTKTLITNPLSNAITFLSNPVETGIAATLERGRSIITGKRPQVYFREVNAEIVGAIDGIWNGVRVFLNTLDTEVPQFGGELKIEQAINQVAIPGKIGRVVRYPQRLLTAQDDLAKATIYDSTMKAMAVRLAIRKGLKGEKLTEFVGELLTYPQGKNKRIYDLFDKRVRAEADYRTYNKALGKIGQMVMNLRDIEFPAGSGVKPLYYVVPFIRTPTNIVKYGLERTPFNFARVGYQTFKGNIPDSQISEEFAKPIIGTLMFLLTWLLYEYGYITGGAPKDDSDRKIWYAAGKKEYSFYAPWIDRHISYQRIEPLGSILGMSADFFENIHRGVKNPKDATIKIMTSISKNWTNKTFVLGLTNAMNAYTDPERYGDKFVDGLTSSLVPNIISSFNPDPYYREKDSFLDSIKAKVPGLSETLPPKRDVYGGAAMKGEGRGSALMNQILPFGVTKPTDDPVRMELLRLNDSIDFSVGESPRYFRINKEKINIPPKMYSEYVRESGELAHSIIGKTIKSDGYKKTTDERRAEKILNDFNRARNYIRPRYIRQLQQK